MATQVNKIGKSLVEQFVEGAAAILLVSAALITVLWLTSANKIVYNFTPILARLAWPMSLVPLDTIQHHYVGLLQARKAFMDHPGYVGFPQFVAYANYCLMPLSTIFVLTVFWAYYFFTKIRPPAMFRRMMSARQLSEDLMKTFPAIAPVVCITADLIADKNPKWRRQFSPEDVIQGAKVRVRFPDGRTEVQSVLQIVDIKNRVNNEIDGVRFEGWLQGVKHIELDNSKDAIGAHQFVFDRTPDGRMVSRTLGAQMLHIPEEFDRVSTINFVGRMRPTSAVLYCIYAAFGFGGPSGREDAKKAMDELNRSAYGNKDGVANLSVAQWLIDKYGQHPDAKKIFAMHHWENTALWGMFLRAKRNGVITNYETIWCKPMDRQLYFCLDSVGRDTPHAEAGAVFAQHDYERMCWQLDQFAIERDPDRPDTYRPRIMVKTAMGGFDLAWNRYRIGTEDDDDWWTDAEAWSVIPPALKELRTPDMRGVPLSETTAFDAEQLAQREQIEKADAQRLRDGVSQQLRETDHDALDELLK